MSVTPNTNEIRDFKYVDKEELQAMFNEPGDECGRIVMHHLIFSADNLFTPWFKLIARDFLFGWWDTLIERKGKDGKVFAKSLAGVIDGSKVVKMI